MNKEPKISHCPEIPWFGAHYPDARCIDGYLWDLDSCGANPNVFHRGGDDPCPFCNKEEFIEACGSNYYNSIIEMYGQ